MARHTNAGRSLHWWETVGRRVDGVLTSRCRHCGLTQTLEDLVQGGVEAVAETTRLPSGRVVKAWCSPRLPGFRAVGGRLPECPRSPAAWVGWEPVDRPD